MTRGTEALDWSGYDDMEAPPEFSYPEVEPPTGEHEQISGKLAGNAPSGKFEGNPGKQNHKTPGQTAGKQGGKAQEDGDRKISAPLIRGRTFPAPHHGYRFMEADEFLFAVEDAVPIWGDVDQPLWQSGESLMLVGPPGVGKSTLAHHLLVALLTGTNVLGHPVAKISGNILYLAMDRPKQIARAFRRVLGDAVVRELVRDRVIFHAGPLPRNLVLDPTIIAKICAAYGITVVVVDSIKDAITSPSDETQANSYNIARQKCLADGVEWIELHHNRKSNGDNKEPKGLDDVYGNRFITAGAGSIFSLWGQSGDSVISLSHIRMPGNGLPPLKLGLDKDTGAMELLDVVDLEALTKRATGVTAKEAAVAIFGSSPSESQIRTTRYRLKRLIEKGRAYEDRTDGADTRFRFTSGVVPAD